MSKFQPTATEFTRTQSSWATFVLEKVRGKITDREEELREAGASDDDMSDDNTLMDLYDDELFYLRYGEEMIKQRAYLRNKYLGGE